MCCGNPFYRPNLLQKTPRFEIISPKRSIFLQNLRGTGVLVLSSFPHHFLSSVSLFSSTPPYLPPLLNPFSFFPPSLFLPSPSPISPTPSPLRYNNYIFRSGKVRYGASLIRWRRNVWRKLTWKSRQDVKMMPNSLCTRVVLDSSCKTTFPSPGRFHGNPGRVCKKVSSGFASRKKIPHITAILNCCENRLRRNECG